jgi:hypothetical protein
MPGARRGGGGGGMSGTGELKLRLKLGRRALISSPAPPPSSEVRGSRSRSRRGSSDGIVVDLPRKPRDGVACCWSARDSRSCRLDLALSSGDSGRFRLMAKVVEVAVAVAVLGIVSWEMGVEKGGGMKRRWDEGRMTCGAVERADLTEDPGEVQNVLI